MRSGEESPKGLGEREWLRPPVSPPSTLQQDPLWRPLEVWGEGMGSYRGNTHWGAKDRTWEWWWWWGVLCGVCSRLME